MRQRISLCWCIISFVSDLDMILDGRLCNRLPFFYYFVLAFSEFLGGGGETGRNGKDENRDASESVLSTSFPSRPCMYSTFLKVDAQYWTDMRWIPQNPRETDSQGLRRHKRRFVLLLSLSSNHHLLPALILASLFPDSTMILENVPYHLGSPPLLPIEIKAHILCFCSPSDLASTSRVSLAFFQTLHLPSLSRHRDRGTRKSLSFVLL